MLQPVVVGICFPSSQVGACLESPVWSLPPYHCLASPFGTASTSQPQFHPITARLISLRWLQFLVCMRLFPIPFCPTDYCAAVLNVCLATIWSVNLRLLKCSQLFCWLDPTEKCPLSAIALTNAAIFEMMRNFAHVWANLLGVRALNQLCVLMADFPRMSQLVVWRERGSEYFGPSIELLI